MTVNIKLQCSAQIQECLDWHCHHGITPTTMKKLNEEFNHFRGLFPLKVFLTGPPCSGKTHFASKLNELYGVPHYKIQDIVTMGKALKDEHGDLVKKRIEELKDQAEADYEKTRKKKDPDFDRANFNPRLPDDILYMLVRLQLNSVGCMNKGFILEGYPRTENDARNVFMDKVETVHDTETKVDWVVNDRIVPQYTLHFEGEDPQLLQKAKELPPSTIEGTHWNDAGMVRRLKDYRAKNTDASSIHGFMRSLIGPANVLSVNVTTPEVD